MRLRDTGFEVSGTTRSESRAEALENTGITPLLLELDNAGESPLLGEKWDTAIYCAAPGRDGNEKLVLGEAPVTCRDRLRESGLARFVYVSSTGVYQQAGGELLDETSPAEPREGRPLLLREAERRLLREGAGENIVVRLGGLYGPGRSPVEWLQRPGFRERMRGGA